jgi:hypothetical protein
MLSCHVKIMYLYILTNKFTQIGVHIYIYVVWRVHGIINPCKKCAFPLTTTLIQIVPSLRKKKTKFWTVLNRPEMPKKPSGINFRLFFLDGFKPSNI